MYQNPGVYVREVPSGARPIEVAGTSTAAFLGYASTGPAIQPTLVESYEAYVDTFGTISATGTDQADKMGLAVRAFFQNGGRRAYIVNVSSGATAASGSLGLDRSDPPVELYAVTASGSGDQAEGLEVLLSPRNGGANGRFDLRIVRRDGNEIDEVEAYSDVTIAPGLPQGVAQTLAGTQSAVRLEPHEGLAARVYPSVEIDFAVAANRSEWTVALPGFPEPADGWPRVSLAGTQALTGDALAAECQTRLNASLRTAGVDASFACGVGANDTTVRCLLETARANAGIRLDDPAGNRASISAAATRGQLLATLLGSVEHDNDALLSGDLGGLDASRLNGKKLSLRFGKFGRTMTLSGFNRSTTLTQVAQRVRDELDNELPMYAAHRPQVSWSNDEITLSFGDDALAGSSFQDGANWVDTRTWTFAAANEVTFKFRATGISERTVTADTSSATNAEEAAQAIQDAIGQLTQQGLDVHVEVIGTQLLIRQDSNDVEALASDGARKLQLSTANAVNETLSTLQAQLPIVAELTGGTNGSPGDRDAYTDALRSLETQTEVGIVLLPGKPWDRPANGSNWLIIEDAIRHAEQQQDRMVIVDPPRPGGGGSEWNDGADVQEAALPTSSHSAVYYPWVQVPTSATPVDVAPSAFAAGVWSRTDESRGVWKAPAGVDASLSGVASLRHDVTDTVSGSLNREGVNCLRQISGYGFLVWGARTRAVRSAPEWKYLSVRRLALMIEDSLRDSMLWAVHQPNRSELWSALRLNIDAFLSRLHRAGAFQPDAPGDAYFVQCGLGTTMTQADIDAGLVRVRVGIAPVKPAEFIEITIEQITES